MRNDIINTDLAINDSYMSERNTKVIADSASELLENDLDSMTEAGLIRGGRRRREKQREKYREALRKRIDIMENSENVSSFENGQMHYGSEPDDANSKFGKMADKVLSKTIRSSYNVDDREDDSLFGFINRDLGGKFKNEAELLEYWRRNEFVGTDENGKPKLTGGLTDDEIRNRLNEYANRYGEYLQSMSKEEYNRRFINPVVDALNSLEKVLNGYGAGDRFNGARTDLTEIGSNTSDAGFKTNSDFWRYLGFIYNGQDATKQPYEMKHLVPVYYGFPQANATSVSVISPDGTGSGNGSTDNTKTKDDKGVTDVKDPYDGNWIFQDKDEELYKGNVNDEGKEGEGHNIFYVDENGNYTADLYNDEGGLTVSDLKDPSVMKVVAKTFSDIAKEHKSAVPYPLDRYGSYDASSEKWFWAIPIHDGDKVVIKPFIYYKNHDTNEDVLLTPSRNGKYSPIINITYNPKGTIFKNVRGYYNNNNLNISKDQKTPRMQDGGNTAKIKGVDTTNVNRGDTIKVKMSNRFKQPRIAGQPSPQNGSSSTTTTSDGKVVDADYQEQFDKRKKADEDFNEKHPYLRIARFFQLAGDLASIFVPNPALGAASVTLGSVLDGFDPNVTKGQLLKNLGLGAISLVNPLSKLARISKRAPEIIMGVQKVANLYGLGEGVTTLLGKMNRFFEDVSHGVGIKDAFTANFSPQDLTLILSGLRGFANMRRTKKTAEAVNEKLTGDESGATAVPSNRIKEVYGDAVYKDEHGQNRSQPVSVNSSNFKSQEVANGVNSMANKYNNAYEKQTGRPGDVTIKTPPAMNGGIKNGLIRRNIGSPTVANAANNLSTENNVTYNQVIKQNESGRANKKAEKLIEERNKEVENKNSGSIKLDRKEPYNVEPTQPFVFDKNGNPYINVSSGSRTVQLKEGMYYDVDGRHGRIIESPFESNNTTNTIYKVNYGQYSFDPNGSSKFILTDDQASKLGNFFNILEKIDSKQDGGELTKRLKAVNDWNDYARNNPWYISSSTESQTYEGQPIGGDGRYHDNNIENLRDFARGFFDRNPGYKELLGIDDVNKWAYDIVNHKIYPNDVHRGERFYAPIINFDEEGNMSYSQNSSDPNYNINNNVSGIPGPAFPNVGTYSNVSDGSKSAQPIAQGTSNGSAQSATQGASSGSTQTTSAGANASAPNENGSSGNASANGQPLTSSTSGSESANQSAAVGTNTNPVSATPTGQTAQGQVKSGDLSSVGDGAVTGNDNGTEGSNVASNNAEGVNPSGNASTGASEGVVEGSSKAAGVPDKTNDLYDRIRALTVANPVNTEFYGYRKGIFNPLWVTRPLPSALNASTNTLLNAEADKNRMTLIFPGNDKQKTVRVEGDYEGLQEARDNFARMRESLSDYVSTDMAKNIDNYNNVTYNGIGMVHQAEAADRGAFRQSREKALSDIDNNRNSLIESGNVNEKILTDELNRRNAIDYEAAANVRDNMYNAVEDVKDRFVHLRSIYNYLYADEDAKAIAARQIENKEKLVTAINDAAVQIAKNVALETGRSEDDVLNDLKNGNAGYIKSSLNGETSYLYNNFEYLRKQYDKIKNRNFESEAKRSILSTVPGSLNISRYHR